MFLILTQLLVFILLLALFFFFAVLPLDSEDGAAVTPPPSTSSNVFFFDDFRQIDSPHRDSLPSLPTTTTTQQHQSGQNQIIKSEIETNGSFRREEIMEEEEASSLYVHPCHYFQLATVAFLKCFGLDSTSDGPSTRKHRKRKQS